MTEVPETSYVVIEGTKAEMCERLGVNGRETFQEAQQTFLANLEKHLANPLCRDEAQAVKAAIADTFLAGWIRGKELAAVDAMRGSRQ